MDKFLLTLRKTGIKLHSISVMFFLFFSSTGSVISPDTKKRLNVKAFSYEGSLQKKYSILRRKSEKKKWLIMHDYFTGYRQKNIIKKTEMNLKMDLPTRFWECNSVCHMNLSVHPFIDLSSSN
jgi:hypothetical protein